MLLYTNTRTYEYVLELQEEKDNEDAKNYLRSRSLIHNIIVCSYRYGC